MMQVGRRSNIGLQWNCSHAGAARIEINAFYDHCQLIAEEVREAVRSLVRLVEDVTKEENWGKGLGVLGKGLDGESEEVPIHE